MSDAAFQRLLDEDAASGGCGWSEIVGETWRARAEEKRLEKLSAETAKALLQLWHCAHGEGVACRCRKSALKALAKHEFALPKP